MNTHPLLEEIQRISREQPPRDDFLHKIASAINRHFPHYTWVGFYFLKGGKLLVGPYIGPPTPHTVIDLDHGICGAAVSRQETIVVDDVNADPRYLACSLETKSEIVVPIRIHSDIIGELDIDSNRPAAFSSEVRALLEKVAEIVGKVLEQME